MKPGQHEDVVDSNLVSPDALGARPFVLKGNAGYAEFASCTVCLQYLCHVNAVQRCQLELSHQSFW